MPTLHARRIPLTIAAWMMLSFLGWPAAVEAAGEWTEENGKTIEGDLVGFDFETKEASFKRVDGTEFSVTSDELSRESRWRLMLSPTFAGSFPDDHWSPQQRRYLLFAISGPAFFLLVSFYLCAVILFKNGNPLRAIAGWVGSVLLGGFLGGFYLTLSGRNPSTATGVLVFGALVCLAVLSLYVSVIYGRSFTDGLRLLLFHVFGGFFFFAIALFVTQRVAQSFDIQPVIEEKVMIPVGLLPDN